MNSSVATKQIRFKIIKSTVVCRKFKYEDFLGVISRATGRGCNDDDATPRVPNWFKDDKDFMAYLATPKGKKYLRIQTDIYDME